MGFKLTDDENNPQQLTITTNGNWEISCDQTWVVIGQKQGSGNATVAISVTAATPEVTQRSATLTVKVPYTVLGTPLYKEAPVTITQSGSGEPVDPGTPNVADIRKALDGLSLTEEGVEITDDLTLTGILLNDYEGNNTSSSKNLMLQDNSGEPASGIMVRLNASTMAKDLKPGQVLTMQLKGSKAADYNGIIQIAPINDDIIKVVDTELQTLVATEVTDPAKLADYQSQYVKLYAQPTEAYRSSDETKHYYYEGTQKYNNPVFEMKSGATFKVSVIQYAGENGRWAATTEIKPNAGWIKGCVTLDKGTGNLSPRNAADVSEMNDPLFTITAEEKTIADITSAGEYTIKNATVAAVSRTSVVLTDASQAFIAAYISGKGHSYEVGDLLPEVTGTVRLDVKTLQFNSPEIVGEVTHGDYTPGSPRKMTGADVTAWMEAPKVEYVEVNGVYHFVSGKYNNLTIEGTDVTGSISNPLDEQQTTLQGYEGMPVVVKGYAMSDYSGFYTIIMTEVALDQAAGPFVTITGAETLSFKAEGEAQTVEFTTLGVGSNKVFAALSGDNADQFTVTDAAIDGTSVEVTAKANAGEMKKATLTIYVAADRDSEKLAQATVNLTQSPAGVSNYVPVTSAPADWSGDYVIGYPKDDKNCYIIKDKYDSSNKTTFTYDLLTESVFDGTNIAYSAAYKTITIAKIAGTEYYSLKFGSEYIGWTNGIKNYCAFTTEAPTADTPDYQWTLAMDSTGKLITLTVTTEDTTAGKPVRQFQFNANTGQERFSVYGGATGGSQKNVMLYKLQ